MIEELQNKMLRKYPKFLTRNPSSNNYKMVSVLVNELRKLDTQRRLLDWRRNLNRPFKIWREQTRPHVFSIRYEVNVPNIKQVKLIKEGTPDVTVMDSGVLPEGVDTYSESCAGTCPSITPTERWYVEVETYHEDIFQKGFPHNDTPLGDMYDTDPALDMFGRKYGVPRRILLTTVADADLPDTYPKFCNDELEWDYTYENRIIEHMEEYQTKRFPETEIKKDFGVFPEIRGRWRSVCRQDLDKQNKKFMATENWNASVADVFVPVELIPKNFKLLTQSAIESILDVTFPICKRAFFALLLTEGVNRDVFVTFDSLGFETPLNYDRLISYETLSFGDVSANYIYKAGVMLDELSIDIIVSLMTTGGTIAIPLNPQLYPKASHLSTENGCALFGDYDVGFIAENGDEITTNMIQITPDPEPPVYPPSWDTFGDFTNKTLIGVSFDNVRFFNEDDGVEVGNLLIYAPSGTAPYSNDSLVCVSGGNQYIISKIGEIGEDIALQDYIKYSTGHYIICANGIYHSNNYIDLSSILTTGEEIIDVFDYPYWDSELGTIPYYIILTDSRILKIKCDYVTSAVTFIDDIPIANGLIFCYPSYSYDVQDYMGVITSDSNIVTFKWDPSVTELEITATESLPSSFFEFMDNYGFNGFSWTLRIPGSIFELFSDNPFTGCVEAIFTQAFNDAYVLTSTKVSHYTPGEVGYDETVIVPTLPQANPHHICLFNTFAGG